MQNWKIAVNGNTCHVKANTEDEATKKAVDLHNRLETKALYEKYYGKKFPDFKPEPVKSVTVEK